MADESQKMPGQTQLERVLTALRAHGDAKNVEGMARFGIRVPNALGVSAPVLRGLAKDIGRDHTLAGRRVATGTA